LGTVGIRNVLPAARVTRGRK